MASSRAALREKVLAISPAQIDRLLAPRKARYGGKGRCGTKPGGLLKHQIPIRTSNWDITRPGYLEADTVAHCGGILEGDFIWSVTYTDIFSGWTANRAVWNKGATGIVAATEEVEGALPFDLLGFDCDNGSEFLNWHLVRYFQERHTARGLHPLAGPTTRMTTAMWSRRTGPCAAACWATSGLKTPRCARRSTRSTGISGNRCTTSFCPRPSC